MTFNQKVENQESKCENVEQNLEKEMNENEIYKKSDYGLTVENKNDKSKFKLTWWYILF